ncbi:LOW QUALITY PROTEIN: hypothetical protein CRUP_021042 [Coryphaenoides rupestris]|nr:LOW QUALITY PROTEIN: hypothetical protein CRUP_021042 [Coryphaenoides rupestris]
MKNKFMKKIPRDAEASNVLVGEVDFLDKPFVAFVRLAQATTLGGLTEVPLIVYKPDLCAPMSPRFLFVLLGPQGKARSYTQIGRAIATLMVDDFLDEVVVLPPGEWDPKIRIEPPKKVPSTDQRKSVFSLNELNGTAGRGGVKTRRCLFPRDGGGASFHRTRKLPWVLSDFCDGFHLQSISAVLFIYLGCITNAITFGGLLGDATDNYQGVMESFLGTALAGTVFCLFGGQPLIILSSTGPILIFEKLLFEFSNYIIKYMTRFTEEGFSSLISFIFISDAIKKMLGSFKYYPINTDFKPDYVTAYKCECLAPDPSECDSSGLESAEQEGVSDVRRLAGGDVLQYVPDLALMSFILFFGTYSMTVSLKKFKSSRYFPTKPTRPGRGWLVMPFGKNPLWVCVASFIPALLVTILIFMDQQISAVIVNRKENKLKKGCGYHLDLFWVGVLMAVCSFLGLPWYVAATVISIAHIDSLKMESESSAPRGTASVPGVREQRLTGILVFVLTGVSIFLAPILQFIPMPVLYGVFLYMGVASLSGIQVTQGNQLTNSTTHRSNGIDYMELRLWIGLHSCLQCFLLVATDASYIIKYMTRFTEEGFSSLISFIFISDAIKKMLGSFNQLSKKECLTYGGSLAGTSCKYVPDLALMSFILFFGTYSMTVSLKKFKSSRYFPTKPTRPGRGWLVMPFGKNPLWVCVASFIPALLVTILIFMDQQISAVIVNRKENKLKKGCGYHLDLFWVGVLMAVCSFLGLPWYVAATVISIAHIDSLKMESESSAPGEQPQFLGVREQRLTGILVFVLTGVSIFLAPILQFIPMPVLYGVFLYMGVASLSGIQFWDRIKLYLMPSKHQPDFSYLRHVPLRRVHLFTLVQILCLAVLWTLKSTFLAIIFPIMILGLMVVRKMLDMVFSQHDLAWMDDILPEKKKKKKKNKDEDKKKKKGKDKKREKKREEDWEDECQRGTGRGQS